MFKPVFDKIKKLTGGEGTSDQIEIYHKGKEKILEDFEMCNFHHNLRDLKYLLFWVDKIKKELNLKEIPTW